MNLWRNLPPLPVSPPIHAHGGILTGHWEFDLAIAMVFFAIISYSFLVPSDAPQGMGRIAIQGVAGLFFVGALVLAIVGFRSL